MAQVREAETYHTASVMHDALSEADRLCAAIYRAVTDAYFKRPPQGRGRHRPDRRPDGRVSADAAKSARR